MCGGLRTDLQCRVLDEDDQPIEGLYVCGLAAGDFFGAGDYPTFVVPAIGHGRCVTFRRMAGINAAGGGIRGDPSIDQRERGAACAAWRDNDGRIRTSAGSACWPGSFRNPWAEETTSLWKNPAGRRLCRSVVKRPLARRNDKEGLVDSLSWALETCCVQFPIVEAGEALDALDPFTFMAAWCRPY